MTKKVSKRATKKESTLWHLRHIQMTLHQHVTDQNLPKTVRPHLEQASKEISSARLILETRPKGKTIP